MDDHQTHMEKRKGGVSEGWAEPIFLLRVGRSSRTMRTLSQDCLTLHMATSHGRGVEHTAEDRTPGMHKGSCGEKSSPRPLLGAGGPEGSPEDGKQPGQESHHSTPSVHRHSYCKPASTLMNVSILPLKSL